MPYGSLSADGVQSSTANTAPKFYDGNSAEIGTLCRAWVKFAGASGAISGSFNVSSVTRISTGSYTVNLTTALADTNYCANATLIWNSAAQVGQIQIYTSGLTSSVVPVQTTTANAVSYADPTAIAVSVFR